MKPRPKDALGRGFARAIHDVTAPGRRRLARGIGRVANYIVPNPRVRAVDWIEKNLVIPNGSRPGPVKLDITQRTILDLMQRDDVHTVVWVKPPRAGSSTMTALAMVFQAAWDGNDVIFYERSDPEAQNFHDKKLRPILESSTAIAALVRPDSRSGIQDSWSDIYLANGAAIQHRGVQTDSNFKAIRGRWVFIDEAGDKAFLASNADSEGHKAGQARTRHAEFPDGTIYIGGTPTTPGCVVIQEHQSASVKLRLMMRFPCCDGAPQPFLPNVSQAGTAEEIPGPGLKFVCDDGGDVTRIGYECAHCREWLSERQRNDAMEAGSYEPIPGVKGGIAGVVGLETWAVHAKDPGLAWGKIVEKYRLQLADPLSHRQDWMNLWLAQAFTPLTEGKRDPNVLEARAEDYGCEAPDAIIERFDGIDFQEGSATLGLLPRVEIVSMGVAVNEEKFILKRHVIDRVWREYVDPDTGEVTRDWDRIDPTGPEALRLIHEYLDEGLLRSDGSRLYASRVGCDTGWMGQRVAAMLDHPDSRRLKMVGVKGRNEGMGVFGKRADPIPKTINRITRRMPPIPVGGQGIKDHVAQCLDIEPGPGVPYCFHFPIELVGTDFFDQLTVEELIYDKKNPELCKWDKPTSRQKASNEVLDCIVYAIAVMHLQRQVSMKSKKQLSLDADAAARKPRGKPKALRPSAPKPAPVDLPRPPGAPDARPDDTLVVPSANQSPREFLANLVSLGKAMPGATDATVMRSAVEALKAARAAQRETPAPTPQPARPAAVERPRSARDTLAALENESTGRPRVSRDDDGRSRVRDSRGRDDERVVTRRPRAASILDW